MATCTGPPDAQSAISDGQKPGSDDSGGFFQETRDGNREMLPKVRYCNWEGFVNCFSQDEPLYAIEALLPGTDFDKEVAAESLQRHRHGVKGYGEEPSDVVTRVRQQRVSIQRIRVRSKHLLKIFTRLTEYSWGEKPRTFTQPFKYFVHYHETFQQELKRLRDQALQHTTAAMSQHQDNADHAQSEEEESLEHLECFIDFAENNIMHHIHQFRKQSPTEPVMVRYDHLWYLFRPGDLIFVPPMTLRKAVRRRVANIVVRETGFGHESSMQQKIWKLHGTWGLGKDEDEEEEEFGQPCFRVFAYYLDYDGTSYSAVCQQLDIEQFKGDREVRELALYPLRFASRVDELITESKETGRLYTKFLRERHVAYNGWSLVTDPIGVPIVDPKSSWDAKKQIRPVHIEGDVIVDFIEAFNSDPAHRSEFFSRHDYATDSTASYLTIDHAYLVWSDPQRSKLLETRSEFLFQTNELDDIEQEDYWSTDKFLDPAATSDAKQDLAETDMILLPRRLFAFALDERIFVPIDVRSVRSISIQESAFEQLQLPDSYKVMLKAAVESHMRRQDIEKQLENKGGHLRTQDFIRGKGRGLNIMRKLTHLHGPPVSRLACSRSLIIWIWSRSPWRARCWEDSYCRGRSAVDATPSLSHVHGSFRHAPRERNQDGKNFSAGTSLGLYTSPRRSRCFSNRQKRYAEHE